MGTGSNEDENQQKECYKFSFDVKNRIAKKDGRNVVLTLLRVNEVHNRVLYLNHLNLIMLNLIL